MKNITLTLCIIIFLQTFIYAENLEQKGKIEKKDGKNYLVDKNGKKAEILQGEELAKVFYNWGINELKKNNYQMANTRFEETLGTLYDSGIQNENFYLEILHKTKKIESLSNVTFNYKNKKYYNFYSSLYFHFGARYSSQNNRQQSVYFYEKSIVYNKQNKNAYYNLACSYSILNEEKKAIDCLKKAIHYGFNNKQHILKDKTLNKIKNTKQFKELILKLK